MPTYRVNIMMYYSGAQRASVRIMADSLKEAEQKVLDGQGERTYGKIMAEDTDTIEIDLSHPDLKTELVQESIE